MSLMNLKRVVVGMAIAGGALMAAPAHAVAVKTMTVDLSSIFSSAELGSAENDVLFLSTQPGWRVVGIDWNVNLFAADPSWLSEMGLDVGDASGDGFSLFPGLGTNATGVGDFSGSADLVSLGVDFSVTSRNLALEFFESFDDRLGDWDGIWRSGSVTLTFHVPEPATLMLAGLAIAGAIGASRRRRAAVAADQPALA